MRPSKRRSEALKKTFAQTSQDEPGGSSRTTDEPVQDEAVQRSPSSQEKNAFQYIEIDYCNRLCKDVF